MTSPQPALCDTEAIAFHFGVATSTVRWWASRDRWPPYGTRRHRLWNLWDAQASYEDRHADHRKEAC